jgi:hypothetical protein
MISSRNATITLTSGTEATAEFTSKYDYFFVKNDSNSDAYMSISSGITAGADGVFKIPAGGSCGTMHGYPLDKLYLLGEGSVQVCGCGTAESPFKASQRGGGSGAVDSVNGKTGVVTLDADDVGALPDDTVIPAKVSDLENDDGYTKTEASETNGNIKINGTETSVYTLPNTVADKTYVTNAINAVDVGNVNLFKNSGFNGTTGWATYGAPTVAVNDGVISVTVTDAGLQWICPSDISMFKHGATYTIQAWLKADMPIKMCIGAAWGNKVVVDVTTEWALYTYTYTASTFNRSGTDDDNYIRPVFGTNAPYNNTTFYVKQPKIVEGNHITASWEPSPYDIPQCIQVGKITTDNTGKATVTFPRAFSSAPAVYATSHYSDTGTVLVCRFYRYRQRAAYYTILHGTQAIQPQVSQLPRFSGLL